MSNLMNTSIAVVGSSMHMSVPFSKVDQEKRMVHGFATLDNVDSQDDIVLYEASKAAFERFRGNIREMHDMRAVGKMVSFKPEKLYDPTSGKIYNGIFVSTYVSKGAQDTWEKVIDGTLTGFSIGGEIIKSSNKLNEVDDKLIRIVEEYEVTELSLVDNPANQLANVVSFEKGVQSGYLAKTKTENVFYCRVHNVVQFTDEAMADCHECGAEMVNIGFVESDDPERLTVVKGMLSNVRNAAVVGDLVDFDEGFGAVDTIFTEGEVFIPGGDRTYKATQYDPIAVISVYEENNDTMIKTNHRIVKSLSSIKKMKEVEKVGVEVIENVEPAAVVAESAVEETIEADAADIEPEASVEEPAAEAPAEEKIEKSQLAEIKEMLDGITKALAAIPSVLQAVANSAEVANAASKEAGEVAKSATSDLQKAQSENKELGERLARVETATAFRKSADVGEIVQTPPKVESVWGGHFLDSATRPL